VVLDAPPAVTIATGSGLGAAVEQVTVWSCPGAGLSQPAQAGAVPASRTVPSAPPQPRRSQHAPGMADPAAAPTTRQVAASPSVGAVTNRSACDIPTFTASVLTPQSSCSGHATDEGHATKNAGETILATARGLMKEGKLLMRVDGEVATVEIEFSGAEKILRKSGIVDNILSIPKDPGAHRAVSCSLIMEEKGVQPYGGSRNLPQGYLFTARDVVAVGKVDLNWKSGCEETWRPDGTLTFATPKELANRFGEGEIKRGWNNEVFAKANLPLALFTTASSYREVKLAPQLLAVQRYLAEKGVSLPILIYRYCSLRDKSSLHLLADRDLHAIRESSDELIRMELQRSDDYEQNYLKRLIDDYPSQFLSKHGANNFGAAEAPWRASAQ